MTMGNCATSFVRTEDHCLTTCWLPVLMQSAKDRRAQFFTAIEKEGECWEGACVPGKQARGRRGWGARVCESAHPSGVRSSPSTSMHTDVKTLRWAMLHSGLDVGTLHNEDELTPIQIGA